MNKMIEKKKKGFTIIEVTLFLAVTGLMILGVVGTVYAPVRTQRYNDALRTLREYIASAYSAVISPAAMGSNDALRVRGASDEYAIYGKLLVFGLDDDEERVYDATIVGSPNPPKYANSFVADLHSVLGDGDTGGGGLFCGNEETTGTFNTTVSSFTSLWQTKINNLQGNKLRGALIIARSPSTNTVHTAYYDMGEVSDFKFPLNENCEAASRALREVLTIDATESRFEEHFKTTEKAEICLRGDNVPVIRKIEIAADGHNDSAVNMVDESTLDRETRCRQGSRT